MSLRRDFVERDVDLLLKQDVLVLFVLLLVGPLVSTLHQGHLEFIRGSSLQVIVRHVGLPVLFRSKGSARSLVLLEVGALLDTLHLVVVALVASSSALSSSSRGLLLLDVLEELLSLLHLQYHLVELILCRQVPWLLVQQIHQELGCHLSQFHLLLFLLPLFLLPDFLLLLFLLSLLGSHHFLLLLLFLLLFLNAFVLVDRQLQLLRQLQFLLWLGVSL